MSLVPFPQQSEKPDFLWFEWFRELRRQFNLLSYTATAAPTTGTWKAGDFVKNSSPSEAGAGGSKYIIFGWSCTVSGSPGTWLEVRTLTGN